ncbi:MAG TPA: hypothetical protein VL574_08150, partial [Stellaceae bacterium]|nr:hypothetical protein [Stellaceae bacterium]
MQSAKHMALASSLAEAAHTRRPVDPIAGQLPDKTIADAYQVQEAGTHMALAAGRRLVGRKI